MHLIYRSICSDSTNNQKSIQHPVDEQSENKRKIMKQLLYRGAPYNLTACATSDPVSTAKIAYYRGNAYSLEPASIPANSINCKLQFLGVAYQKSVAF